jgi:hypothetical protein
MLDPVALGMIETKEWPVPYISICAPSTASHQSITMLLSQALQKRVLYSTVGVH